MDIRAQIHLVDAAILTVCQLRMEIDSLSERLRDHRSVLVQSDPSSSDEEGREAVTDRVKWAALDALVEQFSKTGQVVAELSWVPVPGACRLVAGDYE